MKVFNSEQLLDAYEKGERDFSNSDLKDANLKNADLSNVNFEGANLRWTNLDETDLRGANFKSADLRGTSFRGADLRGANLNKTKLNYQIEPGLLKRVAKIALNDGALSMHDWHTCDTCHCIAGWAVYLAENGKELAKEYGIETAGLLILGTEAHSHFFDDDYDAKEYLKSVLEK